MSTVLIRHKLNQNFVPVYANMCEFEWKAWKTLLPAILCLLVRLGLHSACCVRRIFCSQRVFVLYDYQINSDYFFNKRCNVHVT